MVPICAANSSRLRFFRYLARFMTIPYNQNDYMRQQKKVTERMEAPKIVTKRNLRRLIKATGLSPAAFAKKTKRKPTQIYNWLDEETESLRNPTEKSLEKLAIDLGVDVSEFYNTDCLEMSENISHENVIDIEHGGIIKQFIDKDLAIDINRDLVKIERLSPEQFRKVGSYIKGVANTVEDMVGRKPKAG